MITVEQMQYILELSKTHSFHKTAENLYISQPAVSKAIKKVEDELQLKLFDRTTAGVYPTKIGIEFVKIIDEIMCRFNDMHLLADHFSYYQQDDHLTTIKIYCHNTLGNYVLPQIVTGLHSYVPDLNLHVIEGSPQESLNQIEMDSGGIGMGIFPQKSASKWEKLRVMKLCQAEPYLVANKEMMPLNIDFGTTITLTDLIEYPLVLNQFAPPLSEYLLDQLKREGNEPKIALRCPTASIFTKYITEGLACGIVTKLGHFYMFPPSLKNIAYFPIESSYGFDFLLYSHKDFPIQLYQLFFHLLQRQLILI